MKRESKNTALLKAIKRNARNSAPVPPRKVFTSKRRDKRALLDKAHRADWS